MFRFTSIGRTLRIQQQIQTLFIVSADSAVRDSVRNLAESAGLQTETFTTLQMFLDAKSAKHRGCLVLDIYSGDLKDAESRARLAAACASLPAILVTDRGDVPTAVNAIKAGAVDVVQKPYGD